MSTANHKACPLCGAKVLPIVYGLPSADAFERDGEDLILGGCVVGTPWSDAQWQCVGVEGHRFLRRDLTE